jgi:hypothetical protein
MSRNPIEMGTCMARRRRLIAALACSMAAGLGASGCGNDEATCDRPYDEPRAFLEVRDRNGACTQCNAEDGLTLVLGLANGCDNVARFTTSSTCLLDEFVMVRDSGEMVPAPIGCLPAITDVELQPGEVKTSEGAWGRTEGDLSSAWGPPEPGHYRFVATLTTDLMTGEEIAPPVEHEIIVTGP